jgi:hypothetical protein
MEAEFEELEAHGFYYVAERRGVEECPVSRDVVGSPSPGPEPLPVQSVGVRRFEYEDSPRSQNLVNTPNEGSGLRHMLDDLAQVDQVKLPRKIHLLEASTVDLVSLRPSNITDLALNFYADRTDPVLRREPIEIQLPSIAAPDVEKVDEIPVGQVTQWMAKPPAVELVAQPGDPRAPVNPIVSRADVV